MSLGPIHPEANAHPVARGKQLGYATLAALARQITTATDTIAVGGIAVMLHGGICYFNTIEIYSENLWATHLRLEAAGIMWNGFLRRHTVDRVDVQMVDRSSLGVASVEAELVEGVRVMALPQLVGGKLTNGLSHVKHHGDFAEVADLITRIPLKKDFAAKLPTKLRAPFKELVEQVHGSRGSPVPPMTPKAYFDKYGSARRRAAI